MPTAALGCLYLLVFSVGTTAGMALMSLVLSAPLVVARRRTLWLSRALRAAAGIGSLLIGLALAWRTGTAGLFG
jgi:sulfite exporter TauE/SafE